MRTIIRYSILILSVTIVTWCSIMDTKTPSTVTGSWVTPPIASRVVADITTDTGILAVLTMIEQKGIDMRLMNSSILASPTWYTGDTYYLGELADWEAAFSTSCTDNTEGGIDIYTPSFEGDTLVPRDFYCSEILMDENIALIDKLWQRFESWAMQDMITLDEYNPERVQSNIEVNPSRPLTPLEKLITIHSLEYKNAVVRVLATRQYHDTILILTAGAQEPWIPWYNITQIYKKDDSLYLKNMYNSINLENMDTTYGTGFTLRLQNLAYEVLWESDMYPDEMIRLLRWSFITTPSIINQRIQEKIIREFSMLQ